ncbi:SNF2-related protein [Promethearchaeum syntrophicum]|uniref:SNF2-related protein n=1 Tax=Promethearchaeum syntrophicum TaxID=2594042 RepID=A0A5B9D6L4_9ARCH|nr:SNF2-related protein [Candidatus Prometheoarchaeum syntrophicum]QEE14480.1 ATP-dependent helicase HepA [Candidatus Prometheoarchaeum syntrophicum]
MVMSKVDFQIGQVVDARNRLWRIERIITKKSEFEEDANINLLEVSSIDGVPSRCNLLLNIVKTSEGKEIVETIENIKEAKILKPDTSKLGNPDFQKVLIQAMRYDLIFGTSNFISLANSRVIPVSYQMVPVLMAMAQEKVRLLIADDVGLGKTIEAGLIIQELLGRRKINRVLFAVPANLREQWRSIMQRFFGIEAKILSSQTRRKLQKELLVGGDPWGYYNFLITSQDYLSRQEILERAIQFKFDMVVIDEAHNIAKPRYMMRSGGNKKSKRKNKMAVSLSKYPHLLLLTATPHNGYHESFASLIHLLNPELVDDKNDWAIDPENAKRFICQRRKADVMKWMEDDKKRKLFPTVHRIEEFIIPSVEFKEVIKCLDQYKDLVFKSAKEDGKGVRFIKFWGVLHIYRRLISSPQALLKTIYNKIRDSNEKTDTSGKKIKLREEEIQDILEKVRSNVTDTNTDENLEEYEIDRKNDSEFGSEKLGPDLIKKLSELETLTKKCLGRKKDPKFNYFYNNTLQQLLNFNKKIIIFTRYIDTADYICLELTKIVQKKSLMKGFEIIGVVGTDPIHVREEKYRKFLGLEKGIMVATDCMSEGIDLQYSSNIVVNYELTWNPNRLEQRNGRVDRFGQPEKDVYLRTLIIKESLELAILDLLYRKIKNIGGDMGYIPKYFGNMDLIGDILNDYFEEEEEFRFVKTKHGAKQLTLDNYGVFADEMKEMLSNHVDNNMNNIISEDSFYGQTVFDFSDVQERMDEMEKSIGNINGLLLFLQKSLPFFDCSIEPMKKSNFPPNAVFKITLSDTLLEIMNKDEITGNECIITTDPYFGAKQQDIETLSLKSPVLNSIISIVKEKGFITTHDFYGRTAAASSDLISELTAVLYYKIRYLVSTKEQSIMEELLPIGLKIYEDKPLLKREKTEKLWTQYTSGKTSDYPGIANQVKQNIKDLFDRSDFDSVIKNAIKSNLCVVVDNSRNLMKNLQAKNLVDLEDLKGMDDISIISYDPISVTLFYPGGY